MGRLLGRLWVGFTLSLISFIAYSSQIFIIWPWYGRVLSIPLLMLLVPFNLLVGMIFWNYLSTVRTDPGTVPKGWQPDLRSLEGYEVKKLTGAPRYCRTCARYKPPRAHHCRQCKKCVLRMDHHCPWVNNCVGHFNYGHFIRFLFFVDVACSCHLAMVSARVWDAMKPSGYFQEPSTSELVFIILNYAACTPVILLVGGFSLYHFYCLASNQTTIEGWEKDKVTTLVKRGKIREIKFPYHLGIRRNICAILGDRAWLWCWPQRMRGSGLSFPVADGTDPDMQFVWPPKDPNVYKDRDISTATALKTRLQGSPWTYGNDGPNPALRARGASSHPPYHPAYQSTEPVPQPMKDADRRFDHDYDDASTSSSPSRVSSDYDGDLSFGRDVRVRRGSEGWEVRPLTNEEIVRRYARSRGLESAGGPEMVPQRQTDQDSWDMEGEGGLSDGINLAEEGILVSDPIQRYNVYVPESPDSSEDEALAAHVGTYTNE